MGANITVTFTHHSRFPICTLRRKKKDQKISGDVTLTAPLAIYVWFPLGGIGGTGPK